MIKAALEYVVGLKKPETVRHGGAWKLEAKKNIYNYLAEQLEKNIDSGEVVLLV